MISVLMRSILLAFVLLLAPSFRASHAALADDKAAPVASELTFNVRDYGAKGDGVADDSEAIQLAIEAATKAGANRTVLIPDGRYYLGPVREGRDKWSYFRIERADHLTVRGQSKAKTILLTSGDSQPFVCFDSSNCVLRDFTIDWKNLNFTQGVITGVDAANGAISAKMDAGYAPPDAEIFGARDGYKPELRVLSPGRNTFNWRQQIGIETMEQVGDKWTFRVAKTDANSDDGKRRREQIGRRFFIWGNKRGGNAWTPLVTLGGVTNFSVENVDDYAGGGFQGGENSQGVLSFINYYCGPPPGSGRLGFYGGHQGHSRAAVVLVNCTWIMSNDDQINALTGLHYIHAQTVPDALTLRRDSDYQVGDQISIWDYSEPKAIKVSATAQIVQISDLPDDQMSLKLDKTVIIKKFGTRADDNGGDARMTSGHDRIVNLSSSGSWTMRNCVFNASFAHPLLLKSYNGIMMTGCTVYGSDMSGLESGMISFWNEGPQTRNVTLRANTFYDNDGVAALFNIGALGGNSTASRDQGNFTIENNLFIGGGRLPVWNDVNPRGVALMIGNSRGVRVRGNLFVDNPNSNIAVYASDDVQIENNTFLRANARVVESNNRPERENLDPRTAIWINNARNVELRGNVSYLTGANNQTLAATGADVSDIRGLESGITRGVAPVYDLERAPIVNGRRALAMQAPRAGDYRVILFYDYASAGDAPAFTKRATGKVGVNGRDAGAIAYANNGPADAATAAMVVVVPVGLKAGRNTVSFAGDDAGVTLRQAVLLLR